MKVWAAVLCAALAVSTPARAQDLAPVVLRHEGSPGLWFSEPDARRMLRAWRRARLVPNLELQIENRQALIENLRSRLDVADQTATLLRERNEELRPRWFRAPAFLLTIGAIVGAALVISISGIVK